jgi:hypothetical protein
MLQVFRSLGGKAENVARKDSSGGRGIVPVDPDSSVHLHAPPNLIFPHADIEFVDGRLRIKDTAATGKAERTFFDNYYSDLSWGGGGRAEAEAFLHGLDQLPGDVRAILSDEFGMEQWLADDGKRVERWFLESRTIGVNGKPSLVPVLDLVNHGPTARRYGREDGLIIHGEFAGEVVVQRSNGGPFEAFRRFGIPSPEPVAFSLPLTCKTGSCEIVIAQHINFNSTLGSAPVPSFEIETGSVVLSCMMIGNSRAPRLPRGIFYRVMREAGQANAEETFDYISHQNRLLYLRLLESLEAHEGGLVPALRKVIRYQLEAMSWCIGTREL